MATQELKTQLVFEAADAIRNSGILYRRLNKIAQLDFSRLAQSFRDAGAIIANVQRQAASDATAIVEHVDKTVQNFNKSAGSAVKQLQRSAKANAKVQDELQKQSVESANKFARNIEQVVKNFDASIGNSVKKVEDAVKSQGDILKKAADVEKIGRKKKTTKLHIKRK